MVESFKRCCRSTAPTLVAVLGAALFCIALLSFSGCESRPSELTILKLEHRPASDVVESILPLLPKDTQYTVTDQQIIIYEHREKLQHVITLLNALDIPPKQYLLEMRRKQSGGSKRYSTQTLPFNFTSLELLEGEIASLNSYRKILYPFFDQPVVLNDAAINIQVDSLSTNKSVLRLMLLSTHHEVNTQFENRWVAIHNQWTSLTPKTNVSRIKNKTHSTKSNLLELEFKLSLR